MKAPETRPPDPAGARNALPTYPAGPAPEPGTAREIAPGVLWLRMPLPFSLTHINLWAIDDGAGWAIIDTGMQTAETASAWHKLIAEAFGGRPITRVFATHMHPDHIGMAGWLTRRFDCRLWMTRLEYLNCRVLVADTGREAPEDGVAFYRRAGWDDEAIEQYKARFGSFGKGVYRPPDSYRRIVDGETIAIGGHEWRVVVGSGHSPEHASLHCAGLGLLVSGDQVLPRISSNVSVFPTEPDADPLGEWLESLERIQQLVPDNVLVLPAHNEPFNGLHSRLQSLRNGHLRGLERLRKALGEPKRVVDLFGALFARDVRTDPHLMNMATGECLAHLNHLLAHGEATVETDVQGVGWYRRAG
ncbi:MAG: MBL fold metallo-hydrolase [Burkholderiales bacterium]|nr:MBL fold metallo-hydrolase [Burkholderiales bacterium]OJX07744.1 MAG: MBL fold metallo-hydrolase [Burkholderiales bacterium 70-64]